MAKRLTKIHFVWLAKTIAPLIKQGELKTFAREVHHFSRNNAFQKSKFDDACENAYLDNLAEIQKDGSYKSAA